MVDRTVYRTLDPDSDDLAPIEIESMCPQCEKNGTTKILLTKIPFYKEVILMSFECPHCGCRNNELQPGQAIAEHGINIALHVTDRKDLDREVVKSEYCHVAIPEVELEIPPKSQPGEITTVEGVITRVIRGVSQDQERRRSENPETAAQIDAFVASLTGLLTSNKPFQLILKDPSGNSFVGPRDAGSALADAQVVISHYNRTLDDQKITCYSCGAPAENDMKIVDIPGFKETVVMGTNCSSCGYRSSEIKAASGISPQGLKLTLSVETAADLSRDVMKSETCLLTIPELELEGGRGVLSGVFTTVEGVVSGVAEELTSGVGSILMGDSASSGDRQRMDDFIEKLSKAKHGDFPFTLILDDPAGNSYIQSLDATEADSRLTKEWYDRSFEQSEDLGINDMNTDDYTQPIDTPS